VTRAALELTRARILAHRRTVQSLDQRLPYQPDSLRRAASAGLQDSMPRAALLSIHARVAGAHPMSWEDPPLVQVWGPRFQLYVIAAEDHALFTLARLPDDGRGLARAEDLAARLEHFLAGRTTLTYGEAGRGVGVHPNALRYAATTGTVQVRWLGARAPTIRTVPRPSISPADARVGLARRYLHVSGPSTAASFTRWAGISTPQGRTAFATLAGDLLAVRTPIGEAWILASDEDSFAGSGASAHGPAAPARFLPSGDPFFLFWGSDRELLVPDTRRRNELWTSRVWPGALLVDGELTGTWRRAGPIVDIDAWRALRPAEREAVEAEAATMPLPDLQAPIRVRWADRR
jgi:hypothetical protein